ncbi:LysR family transcriptional regulator [Mesorhizobium sp.]|uniref:LysR family transcriptional regulator n=1 Tax=Mesorhizobium sp. TaxID=1871066 RepID=UPI0025F3848C|nr:LysR family transcriptional regulator [Mesorhizobium sp.]
MAVKPPRPRMPPLNALRAFEAAARHEGFAKAAEELGVTPAAISHQVKALEAWLGSALFVRHPQGLHLTEAGRAALPAFSTAFDAMGLAVQDLRASAPRPQVSIAALPSIAQLWLAPRLPALRMAHPALRPSIHALEEPPDFRREPFDLAIFLTRPGGAPGSKLRDDVIFPVCAPALARQLGTPSDLTSQLLLWDTTWTEDWNLWFKAAGVKGPSIEAGSEFSLYSLALQAAIDGAGVLMGHEALASPALAAGSLVAPFPELRVPTGLELTILAPERPTAQAIEVMEWLLAHEAGRD